MEMTVGTKLQIVMETQKEEKTLHLTSQLETIGNSNVFLISAPIYKELVFPIPDGYDILVQFFDKSAIVSFEAKVLGRTKKDNLYFLLIRQTGEMRRIQRREDFRLDVTLPGQLEYIPHGETQKTKMKVYTTDLSGGGASVRAGKSFEIGDNVTAYLPMDQSMQLSPVPCDVRRCIRLENVPPEARYNVGLRFLFEDNKRKEKLIQYIFKLEREKRKSSG